MLLLPGTVTVALTGFDSGAIANSGGYVNSDMVAKPRAAYPGYVTRIRNSPSGGAVGPASRRSIAVSTSAIFASGQYPRPTCTKLPAIARTMLYRNPSASTSIQIVSPNRLTDRWVIVRTLVSRFG